jgi:hypothetical protein
MEYSDFVLAGLAAVTVGSMIYLGFAAIGKGDFTTADADMVAMAVAAVFVSIIVARHPEWL